MDLRINAVPTLLFFKDGKLLTTNVSVNGHLFLEKGRRIGGFNEHTLREIVKII